MEQVMELYGNLPLPVAHKFVVAVRSGINHLSKEHHREVLDFASSLYQR
jgi:hypothetical protein